MTANALSAVTGVTKLMHANRSKNFGNARDVRKLYERVIEPQAARVAHDYETEASVLEETDIISAATTMGLRPDAEGL